MVGKKILAVSSGGGHWQQLQLIAPAFQGHNVVFATTQTEPLGPVRSIPDCNRDDPLSVLRCLVSVMRLVVGERPDVVISTGALPGLLATFFGRLIGARTIWLDSVANAEEMSLSGKIARYFAALCLTQWPDVAARSGARYQGAVL